MPGLRTRVSDPFGWALDVCEGLRDGSYGLFNQSSIATVELGLGDFDYRMDCIVRVSTSVVSGMGLKHLGLGIWCRGMAMAGNNVP